jgi:hypothetical protein
VAEAVEAEPSMQGKVLDCFADITIDAKARPAARGRD